MIRRYSRYSGIISPNDLKRTKVGVIGLGSIGSQVATSLARTGFGSLHIQDFDSVDEVNFGVQNYNPQDMGKLKTVAIKEKIIQINPQIKIQIHNQGCSGKEVYLQTLDFIVFALDSISDREKIFRNILNRGVNTNLIDGRMGAETARIISVRLPDQHDVYENTLFSSDEAEQVPCTEKATLWNSLIIGGLMVGSIIRMLRKDDFPPDYLFSIKDYSLAILQKKGGQYGD